MLAHRNIILGVTGSIAAYKSAEIIRQLQTLGANVRVIMTQAAKAFITPLTLQALSGHPVHDDLLDKDAEAAMSHIQLAKWADLILIAPASANCIAKLAAGQADDLLGAVVLASDALKAIAPAMNQQMFQDTICQENLKHLQAHNWHCLGPESGQQACGDVGPGRLLDPEKITHAITTLLRCGKLAKQTILITAGPTQEAIDPVRYLTNHSSGKMGYALALAAKEQGARVILVSGPTQLQVETGIERIQVTSADEMYQAAHEQAGIADIFIGAAAVADYRPAQYQTHKIIKTPDTWQLKLVRTRDIIATLSRDFPNLFMVGFSAQTQAVIEKAKQKLQDKHLDIIIANDISQANIGFGSDEHAVTVITLQKTFHIEKCSKYQCARHLIDFIGASYHGKYSS